MHKCLTHSERQFGLSPEGTDQGRATLHGAQAVASTGFQIREVAGAAIGELVVLEMPPDVLGGVELRGIARELLDLDGALEGFEVPAHQRAAMRGQAVPDHEQGLADLSAERVQELDDLRALDEGWLRLLGQISSWDKWIWLGGW